MLEIVRRLRTATSGLHRSMKDTADPVGAFLVDAFHYLAVRNWRDNRLVSGYSFHRNDRPRSGEPRRHPPLVHLS